MFDALPVSVRDALQVAQRKGVLRARDLEEMRVPRHTLSALLHLGLIRRVEHGTYVVTGTDWSEHQTLIEVAQRVPHGVICLLSALRFHEIGTQESPSVWLCIESKAWAPKLEMTALEIVRQSGRAWSEGVGEHPLPIGETRVAVKITSPAKTVADCFKFRSRVGLDVALEALRDGLHQKKVTHRELWHFAEIDRVTTVMRPYMEAMATP